MGICTCVGKDFDQTNKNSLNVSELVNPDQEKPIEHKNYKKEQTDQTNALETEKNRNNNIQHFIYKKITISKLKDKNVINIIILGAAGVGKSAFLIKLTESTFEKPYIPTICCDSRSKIISYNTHNYRLNLTDTATNEYKEDYSKIYQCVDFFFVFYDVSSYQTYNEAKKIIDKEIRKNVALYDDNVSNVVLISNKNDIQKINVPIDEVSVFCKTNKFMFFEISVKTNLKINILMQSVIKVYDSKAYPFIE